MVLDLRQPKSKSLNIALTCHICENCDDLLFFISFTELGDSGNDIIY